MATKLGQLLIEANLITEEQLKEAMEIQKRQGGRLGSNLVKLGYITEEKLVSFLSKFWGVPAVNLSEYKVDPSLLKLIPVEIARKYIIFPVARVGSTLTLAMADPSNIFVIDDVKFMTGYNVEPVVASESSILNAISTYYSNSKGLTESFKLKETGSIQLKDYTFKDSDFDADEMRLGEEEGSL